VKDRISAATKHEYAGGHGQIGLLGNFFHQAAESRAEVWIRNFNDLKFVEGSPCLNATIKT
jgi:hypothetical protein